MKFNNLIILLFLSFIMMISGCSLLNLNKINNFNKSLYEKNNKFYLFKIWDFKLKKNKNIFNINPIIDKSIIFIASKNGKVYALNINNGKKIWKRDLSIYSNIFLKNIEHLSGGLSKNKNKIYIGSENANLYSLNSQNGSIIWSSSVSGEVLSTPIIKNGFIFVHTGNGMIQSLYEYNGLIKWTLNLDNSLFSLRKDCDPVIYNKNIIVGDNEGNLNSINIKTGKIIWKKKINIKNNEKENNLYLQGIKSKPIIYDNIIYTTSCNGNIFALDAKSGKTIWHKNIGSLINMLLDNFCLYLVDKNDNIISININNGSIIWKQNILINKNITSPILYKNYLLFGDKKGYIYWINKKNGNLFIKQKIDNNKILNIINNKDNQIIIQSEKGYISSFTI
ncbi:PQQ-binding-like beta-propeller repeat protein [Sodalis-like secondary symbiont of Drepanosiphum platanoidis]|uniref:outer membrane protein assembly factor BamB family protein n=1 Tax=Sodalis-like secondary symbiont of Drepanosiphum platanoidis TaxID=2994493 RepID=UPI003463DEB5